MSSNTPLDRQLSRMKCQTFSCGLSSGHLGGSRSMVMLWGTTSLWERCHPAWSASSRSREVRAEGYRCRHGEHPAARRGESHQPRVGEGLSASINDDPLGNSHPIGVIGNFHLRMDQHWKPKGVKRWRRNTMRHPVILLGEATRSPQRQSCDSGILLARSPGCRRSQPQVSPIHSIAFGTTLRTGVTYSFNSVLKSCSCLAGSPRRTS